MNKLTKTVFSGIALVTSMVPGIASAGDSISPTQTLTRTQCQQIVPSDVDDSRQWISYCQDCNKPHVRRMSDEMREKFLTACANGKKRKSLLISEKGPNEASVNSCLESGDPERCLQAFDQYDPDHDITIPNNVALISERKTEETGGGEGAGHMLNKEGDMLLE